MQIVPDFVDDGFEDLLDDEDLKRGGMPMHGIRVLVFIDEEGNSWLKWKTAGEPSVNEMIAMFTRATFLVQLQDYANHHTPAEDDE